MKAHFASKSLGTSQNLVARPLVAQPRITQLRQRGLAPIRAESGGLGGFFKKDDSKQVIMGLN